MHDKPITVALYLLIGLLMAWTPIAADLIFRKASDVHPASESGDDSSIPRVGWILASLTGGLLGLLLPWWRNLGHDVNLAQAASAAAIFLLCVHFFSREGSPTLTRKVSATRRGAYLAVSLAAAVVAGFGTGILETPPAKFLSWHHWGAYIASAELMRDGGRIFHDFPAQYGLGPTSLLAAACTHSCWGGMYFLTGITIVGLASCTLGLTVSLPFKTAAGVGCALAAVAAATLLWDAGPFLLTSPAVTPSTSGLRFLPPTIIAAVLWWNERHDALGSRWQAVGFALFAAGVLWSPESLFMSTAVWAPYYCLRQMAEAPLKSRGRSLAVALLRLVASLGLIFGTALVVYRLLFGLFPDPEAVTLYMLYPPGPEPIRWTGPVLFCLVALGVGIACCWTLHRREGNSRAFRANLVLLLLAYGASSYALGRSHDNNFLNVMPYFALLLVNALALRPGRAPGGLAAGMLASLLALLPLFNWSVWKTSLVEFHPRHHVRDLVFDAPVTQAQLAAEGIAPDDLVRALHSIPRTTSDPIEVINRSYLNLQGQTVWTSLHGAANYAYAPDPVRARFVAEGAKRFRRGGWLVIDKGMVDPWLKDLETAYTPTQDLDFGRYRAIHMAPR